MVVTADQIRRLAASLPRSREAVVRGQIKLRIGRIVSLALAKDGSRTRCGFPKEFREPAVQAEPWTFSLPSESDMRFNRIHVQLAALDYQEMRDLVKEALNGRLRPRAGGDADRNLPGPILHGRHVRRAVQILIRCPQALWRDDDG